MSILAQLNAPQREAAETIEGPVLVLAGAGSGKTRVLTYRIAHMIDELDVAPWRILALTFTNKAAGEMKERIHNLAGSSAHALWMGTFHSICARLLRREAAAAGLDPAFTIYDEDDRRALMRRVLEIHRQDPHELPPRAVISQISRAKNAMLDPEDFARQTPQMPRKRLIAELFATYQRELRSNNALDFDDLLVEAVRLFDLHQDVLARYQERFRYILVDEYQDTNRPQYLLCRQLAAQHRNLCVVGDDDQAIYQFRGADIRNILDFEHDYPEAKVVRLEQNYRSTRKILEAANAVISNNRGRKSKALWTEADAGEPLVMVECETDRVEARYIVQTLRRLIEQEGFRPRDMAVLYRTNAQSRALEEELRRSGLPYVIVGGVRFYERREIRDMLAYLRVVANPVDDVTVLRIINVPRRGIGQTTIQRLRSWAEQNGLPLLHALDRLDEITQIRGPGRTGLAAFRALIRDLARARAHSELPALGERVYQQTGYADMLRREGTPEAGVRAENIAQLIAFMTEFAETREEPTLEAFLEEVALMTPIDEKDETGDAATLMTLHSAKGLEFPVVFLAGMEENLFPTSRAVEESRTNPQAIEEERRLCYVGITRARQRLFLTHACERYAFGTLSPMQPSRFLKELPPELLEMQREEDTGSGLSYTGAGKRNRRPGVPRRILRSQAGVPSSLGNRSKEGVHYEWEEPAPASQAGAPAALDSDDPMAPGRWVRHPKWGRGKVLSQEGRGDTAKLTIQFGRQVKKVIAAYARLTPA